jgi:hypothetical protein
MEQLLCQLLNVLEVSDVGRTEIRTVEPLLPESNYLECDVAVGNLKKIKSLGTAKILATVIQARGKATGCGTHKVINSFSSKEEMLK